MCQIDTQILFLYNTQYTNQNGYKLKMSTSLPRITTRVDEDTQALLSEAAAIAGISSINSFVLNAAIEKAKTLINDQHTLKLSVNDAKLLLDALDNTPEPNVHLMNAVKKYQQQA